MSAASNYKSVAHHHIVPTLGRKKVVSLTPSGVDRLLSEKLDSGLSPSTVKRIRAVLPQALSQGIRWGIVIRNVAALSRSAKIPRKEGRTLTPDQARQLLDTLKGHRNEALMLSTGLRRGEALGLQWKDFDTATGTLVIRRSLKREDGVLVTADTKTSKSRRAINLPPEMVAALKAHKARQSKDKLALGEAWTGTGFIFTTSIGTPIDPRNLNREFRSICGQAGLGDWHPHELRHSAADACARGKATGSQRRSWSRLNKNDIRRLRSHTRSRSTSCRRGHVEPALVQIVGSVRGSKHSSSPQYDCPMHSSDAATNVLVGVSAAATALMALFTWRLGSKAGTQTDFLKEQVRIENDQLALTRDSLDASVKPFLIMATNARGVLQGYGAGYRRLGVNGTDEQLGLPPLYVIGEESRIRASLAIRNVGRGLAIIQPKKCCIIGVSSTGGASEPHSVGIGLLPNPVLPPDESAELQFDVNLANWFTTYEMLTDQLRGVDGELFFEVCYSDIRLMHEVRVRFHAARVRESNSWKIFETQYFDPSEKIEPTLTANAT